MPLLTSLITRVLVGARVGRGNLEPIPLAQLRTSPWLRRSSLRRGVLVGIGAMAAVATPVVVILVLVGVTKLSTPAFIWFKASFAAGLAAIVTPFVGWWELQAASRRFSR